MILSCGIFLMLSFTITTTGENIFGDRWPQEDGIALRSIYSSWPSVHNAARLMKFHKREVQGQAGENEGGGAGNKSPQNVLQTTQSPANLNNSQNSTIKPDQQKLTTIADISSTAKIITVSDQSKNDSIAGVKSQLALSNPGVLKRGLIVFGGFALMAVAYFIFYRRKSKNNDSNNTHGASETNQFRYGVLQSDDRRDNMELSRIPLTMESDDDDDEDLEIFDLGQKKKSLSYVNLQTHDDEVVTNSVEGNRDRDSLLLDIEDGTSDTLINWSNNGNKSIL